MKDEGQGAELLQKRNQEGVQGVSKLPAKTANVDELTSTEDIQKALLTEVNLDENYCQTLTMRHTFGNTKVATLTIPARCAESVSDRLKMG